MSVVASASRLFDLLASRNTAFTQHLRPGRPQDEIAQITSGVRMTLPPEVVEFYRHFDLPKGYAYGPDQPKFFGIYWLLGLEDAVAFWRERTSYDFLERRESEWFPILQESGNGYLVDSVMRRGHHRIVAVFHGLAPEVSYLNMSAMFDTFRRWIREGVLPIEEGHVAGDYAGDQRRVAEIAAELNPGVSHWRRRLRANR